MRYLHTFSFIFALTLLFQTASAQQIPVFNQYIYNPYLYNPARAGTQELGNLYISHQRQWSGMPDAPNTSTATFDTPLKDRKSGVGLMVVSDETHIITQIGAMMSYSYQLNFGERKSRDHYLSLGLSGGFLNQRIDVERATIQNPNDNTLLLNDMRRTTFDLAFGLNYRLKGLNIDFAMPHLANSNINYYNQTGDLATFDLVSHFLGSVRYKFRLGKEKKASLEPVVVLRGAFGVPFQADLHIVGDWDDKIWASLGYRSYTAGAVASFGFRLHESFSIGYSYEMQPVYSNRQNLGHTHEFMLGYRFGHLRKKVKRLKKRVDRLEKHVDEQVDSLGQEIDQVRQDVEDGKTEMEDAKRRLDNAEERLDVTETEVDITQDQIDMLKDEIADIKKQSELLVNRRKIGMVYFEQGKTELTEAAKMKLRNIKEVVVSKNTRVRVEVVGNTSKEGTTTKNHVLATRRALAARDYLLQLGMDPSAIIPITFGEEDLQTGQGSAQEDDIANRRVDIFIVSE